jgi:hypothetical protein
MRFSQSTTAIGSRPCEVLKARQVVSKMPATNLGNGLAACQVVDRHSENRKP